MSTARTSWLVAAIRLHLRSWRFRVWGLTLSAMAVVLCTIPVFGLLGFGFAFVMSLCVSIAALDLGAALVRRARSTKARALDQATSPRRVALTLMFGSAATSVALLAAPILLVSLNALRIRNCDFGFGVVATLAMPVVSAIYASWVGVGLGLAAGDRRKLSNALPILFFVLAALASVWCFYSAPPVYFYNPLVGYFPGNLYDENIDFSGAYLWARIFHFALLGASLTIASAFLDVPSLSLRRSRCRPQRRRRRGLLFGSALAGVAGFIWLQSAQLGFAVSASDIEETLGGHIRTENFDIFYDASDKDISGRIEVIADDHEFRLAQVVRDLGAKPSSRLTSFYFTDEEQKYRWMGAGRVHMAKPWRGEIYLNDQGFPHEVVRHEVAHAVAAEFGAPVFRVSAGTVMGLPVLFNPGLIEGLAVAADWPNHFRGALTPHESVRAMMTLGYAPPLDRVMSTQFFAYSGSRSYTTAGSFVRFLLETYGAEKVRRLYRTGGDFDRVFGRAQAELIFEWRQMVSAIELAPGAADVVRERFRRGSVFERPCPHYVARAIDRVSFLSASGDHDSAIRSWKRVCDLVPGEPKYQLDLARLYVRADRPDSAIPVLEAIAADSETITSSLRAKALVALGRIELDAGKRARATARLERAAGLALGDDDARNVAAMLEVLSMTGPAGESLRNYFFNASEFLPSSRSVVRLGWLSEAIFAEPENALAHYLIGRNLHQKDASTDAVRSLGRALDLGLSHILLTRECARLLAESAYLADDDEALVRAIRILVSPEQPQVLRLYGLDWLERRTWRATREVPARALGLEDLDTLLPPVDPPPPTNVDAVTGGL